MTLKIPMSALVLTLTLVISGGCLAPQASSEPTPFELSLREGEAQLRVAEQAFKVGDNNTALRICAELSTARPETPGLEPFRQRVLVAVQKQEALRAEQANTTDKRRAMTEVLEAVSLPDRYGIRGTTEPLPLDQLSPDSLIRKQLYQVVGLSLRDVTLSDLIEALSVDFGINMIADPGLGANKRITIEGEGLELREVLRYASRNLGVEFRLGERVIWVTSATAGSPQLESRVYRLRQGIQMSATDWGEPPADVKKNVNVNDIGMLTHKATVPSKEETSIERIVAAMVPEQAGSALHFDRGSHTLFVRNTRENLEQIESIVQALDTTPPQVLIEARFIEVIVDDLSELGVEWLLGSAWNVKSKGVEVDGVMTDQTKIQVSEGSTRYAPYTSGPLGPQGAFGMVGSVATAAQGLNLTMDGVLTDPLFKAVLHALEISGKGRTLSMPRVTTMNNNPAKLRSGSDLRFFEEFQAQAFSLVDANNQKYTVTALIPSGRPSIEELGITLLAVPSVGADRQKITLLLNPSISDLEGFVSYQDDSLTPVLPSGSAQIRQVVVKLPVFTRREVATKLTVQSGDTVVMGGLIDSIEQKTVHKIPILGDIPLVGALFRRTGVTEQRRNLLIFVTATVISDRGESLLSSVSNSTEATQLP